MATPASTCEHLQRKMIDARLPRGAVASFRKKVSLAAHRREANVCSPDSARIPTADALSGAPSATRITIVCNDSSLDAQDSLITPSHSSDAPRPRRSMRPTGRGFPETSRVRCLPELPDCFPHRPQSRTLATRRDPSRRSSMVFRPERMSGSIGSTPSITLKPSVGSVSYTSR